MRSLPQDNSNPDTVQKGNKLKPPFKNFVLLIYVMADAHIKEIRSYNMSRIKGKNTKPEMLVRRFLHANGFRYKLHDKSPARQA